MPRANRFHLPGHPWHITQCCHRQQLEAHAFERNAHWSQSIAIKSWALVTQFRTSLGPSAHHRPLEEEHNACALQEDPAAYTPYFME